MPPNDNDNTLQRLAEFCQADLLGEKWLLAASRRCAAQWKQKLAFSGQPAVNLRAMTLESAVKRLCESRMQVAGGRYADRPLCEFLVQSLLSQLCDEGRLSYFDRVDDLSSLRTLATRTLLDIRLSGIGGSASLDAELFDNGDRGRDLCLLAECFDERLTEAELWDYARCLQLLLDGAAADTPLMAVVDDRLAEHFLERQLLAAWRDSGRLHDCVAASSSPDPAQTVHLKVIAAEGEANEVQGVLRDLVTGDDAAPLDQVELLYSDYSVYAPLIHNAFLSVFPETAIDALPVTFAEGLACIYSRPGRALRAWIRWRRSDYPQSHLVQMIREGLVDAGTDEVGYGYARAAAALRRLPIGLGRDRYAQQLQRAIETAQSKIEAAKQVEGESTPGHYTRGGDFGLSILVQLRKWIDSLLQDSNGDQDSADATLAKAAHFLSEFTRVGSQFDALAKHRLIDEVRGLRRRLEFTPDLEFDVWSWLEDLPTLTHLLSSGPRPGCLHVDHVAGGGATGRPHLCVVGLDDSRQTHHQFQDPLLLDDERQRISNELSQSTMRRDRETDRFLTLFAAKRESVTLCYSTKSMMEDRRLFPSAMFLEAYRELTQSEYVSEHDVLRVAKPVGFLDEDRRMLTSRQQQCSGLLSLSESLRGNAFESQHPHWRRGRLWREAIADKREVGAADGVVPEAGADLDPSARGANAVSASALEAFGACPRRFFFRRGLKIEPPEELVLEDERWLDPLTYGALIHKVFERFMIELTAANEIPQFSRDRPRLLAILNEQVEQAAVLTPVRNAAAMQRQVEDLEKTCDVFLREEARYCRTANAKPFVMEASIGAGDTREIGEDPISSETPVRVALADGQSFNAVGVIDRIDLIGDGDAVQLVIWDYKSGSDWGFHADDPLQHGRKLQPFLYVAMVKHRLLETGRPGEVRRFGYFFPGPRTNGRRLEWSTAELSNGAVLLPQIFQLIRGGCFVATTERSDCRYCDYVEICGDPAETVATIRNKLLSTESDLLRAYQQLRPLGGGRE